MPTSDDIHIYAYSYSTVYDAASAVDHFAAYLTKVEAWLRASRLRIYQIKTKVIWLMAGFKSTAGPV